MALYEYHCNTCDRDFELRRPARESNAPTRCPECESGEVTRKLSLFVAFGKSEASSRTLGESGGCGCGGACACGGHSMN